MDAEFTQERLDSLFTGVKSYRSSTNFRALMKFCQSMKVLAPYNAMLAYIQRPAAKYLLTESKWRNLYGRGIVEDARPVLVLIPFGPLEYLFDVSDTYILPNSKYDDAEMEKVIESCAAPFAANGAVDKDQLQRLIDNLVVYGIAYDPAMVAGTDLAAKVKLLHNQQAKIDFVIAKTKFSYPAHYLLSVNAKAKDAERMASIIHELGHFFCRHLTPPRTPKEWWNYRPLSHEAAEFEAESVSWLICERLGIDSPSEKYLNDYLDKNGEIPGEISVDVIFKAANDVWRMIVETVPLKKGYLHKYDRDFVERVK